MSLNRYAFPAVALLLGAGWLATASFSAAQQGPPPPGYGPPPQGYGQYQDRDDWNMPPEEFSELQRRGYRDGIDGAQKDFDNHRQPNVENRDEYRHPDMPGEMREPYREGFRHGYYAAMAHLAGIPDPYGWDRMPRGFSDIQRRGFHDGIEGAKKDYDNHRRPDVNNRDEYRHPDDVPREMWDPYRDAFRRGYYAAVNHLNGGPGPYGSGPR